MGNRASSKSRVAEECPRLPFPIMEVAVFSSQLSDDRPQKNDYQPRVPKTSRLCWSSFDQCIHKRQDEPLNPLFDSRAAKIRWLLGTTFALCSEAGMTTYLNQEMRFAMLGTVLLVLLILMVIGAVPTWPHSRNWGYYPSGGIGLVLLILLILVLLGHVPIGL